MPDSQTLVRVVRGRVCPGCGSPKKPGIALCGICFRHLTWPVQRGLFKPVGAGFAEGLAVALGEVMTEQGPFWPAREE